MGTGCGRVRDATGICGARLTLLTYLPVAGAQTPTTSALFGSAVYTVDARLATPFEGPYKIYRVER